MSDWCTIESDPGVFTSLIEKFGCQNAQLTELWSLDDESLSQLVHSYGKVYGLVFLFKWMGSSHNDIDNASQNLEEVVPETLFFAKQVTTNACATQAILSILLNAPESTEDDNNGIVLGETLSSFKSFTSSFPADLKGEAIAASDEVRTAHNSFARKETFLMDDSKKRYATKDDDVFHFIAYVPHNDGNVYELDGLAPSPVKVGAIGEVDDTMTDLAWLSIARSAIQKRIEKYAASEIKFNLMALAKDKRVEIQSKIQNMLQAGLDQDDDAIHALNMELAAEEEVRQTWKDENERRQHNYLPFCMELIRSLAKSGKLQDSVNKANARETVKRMNSR
jgi:ubiquitin carboxyl-terminal hydrolase L5